MSFDMCDMRVYMQYICAHLTDLYLCIVLPLLMYGGHCHSNSFSSLITKCKSLLVFVNFEAMLHVPLSVYSFHNPLCWL